MSPGLLYSLGRFACFVVVAALLYVVGFRSWFLVIGALLFSAPLSYVLLRGVRTKWSVQIDERLARRRAEKQRLNELSKRLRGS